MESKIPETGTVLVRRAKGEDGKLATTVTDEGLAALEKLAANGNAHATIASALGINRKDFARLLRDDDGDPRVQEAYARGRPGSRTS